MHRVGAIVARPRKRRSPRRWTDSNSVPVRVWGSRRHDPGVSPSMTAAGPGIRCRTPSYRPDRTQRLCSSSSPIWKIAKCVAYRASERTTPSPARLANPDAPNSRAPRGANDVRRFEIQVVESATILPQAPGKFAQCSPCFGEFRVGRGPHVRWESTSQHRDITTASQRQPAITPPLPTDLSSR